MKGSFYPILQALSAAVLFGASAPFAKLLLAGIDPVPLAAFLYLGSGIGASILFVIQKVGTGGKIAEPPLTRAEIPWMIGATLAGGVAAPILLMWGLKQTPASTASLLLNFECVSTTLIAVMAFKEAVDRRILSAIVLVTLASILSSWTGGAWGVSLGALGVAGACFLWGVDNNLTRHVSAKNPLVIVGIKGLVAGTFSLLLTLGLGAPPPGATLAAGAMLLGSISYGVSIQLFVLAMRSLGAARTSTLFGIAPFVGTFLSVVLLREMPPVLFWLAVPAMLLGAWLMLTERHDHHHIHESSEHAHAHIHDAQHTHTHRESLMPASGMHTHSHLHESQAHDHAHTPDLDHQHDHRRID